MGKKKKVCPQAVSPVTATLNLLKVHQPSSYLWSGLGSGPGFRVDRHRWAWFVQRTGTPRCLSLRVCLQAQTRTVVATVQESLARPAFHSLQFVFLLHRSGQLSESLSSIPNKWFRRTFSQNVAEIDEAVKDEQRPRNCRTSL